MMSCYIYGTAHFALGRSALDSSKETSRRALGAHTLCYIRTARATPSPTLDNFAFATLLSYLKAGIGRLCVVASSQAVHHARAQKCNASALHACNDEAYCVTRDRDHCSRLHTRQYLNQQASKIPAYLHRLTP